jgi:sirohydrochlorin ferrochelatase
MFRLVAVGSRLRGSTLGLTRTATSPGEPEPYHAIFSAMRSILLVDHGSVRAEANHMLTCMASLLQQMVGESVLVRHAHMELAEPSISQGLADCVRAGASSVTVFPYMLSPGKHVTRDVPRLVAEAAAEFPHVACRVTDAFGVHEKLAELIALRAGVEIMRPLDAAEAYRCWEPTGSTGTCGNACAARQANKLATTT